MLLLSWLKPCAHVHVALPIQAENNEPLYLYFEPVQDVRFPLPVGIVLFPSSILSPQEGKQR